MSRTGRAASRRDRGPRECDGCGRTFRGHERRCQQCRATERMCAGCGQTFTGVRTRCPTCRPQDRVCAGCGRTFRSATQARCSQCRNSARPCSACGRTFRGTGNLLCGACRAQDRNCPDCGRVFRGNTLTCPSCRCPERTCPDCGRAHRNTMIRCPSCRDSELTAAELSARWRHIHNARRVRQLGTEAEARPTKADYAVIAASGPCVYCGQPAEHVDHVRPLARGGREQLGNLVPACGRCNRSKHDLLLTEWRPDRVAHGVTHSPSVADEYARLTSQTEDIAS